MSGVQIILVAACLLAGSGVPGLFGSAQSQWGERLAVAASVLAAALGLVGIFLPDSEPVSLTWGLPWGAFVAGLDPLSRAFLMPVLLIPPLGGIYGLGYWSQRDHPSNARKLRLFYGLMPAAMVLVLLARDGALLLLAWEIMALSAFFLVSTEDDQPEARAAGWVYFIATHVGTLSLFGLFAVLRYATGSFSIHTPTTGIGPTAANALFILATIGFGLKAGLMPLHVWLPGAHAAAPSHVSAILSGVMLKMGIYGLVRMTAILPSPPTWWGGTLLAAGAVSAVMGIAFAIGQRDFKRLLAYSSIENIGIITIGVGLALLGRALNQPVWAALGMSGAILHVWNHCLFKPLMFFGAGSVMHATGTRRMDALGGLARSMPHTAALFLVGAVAICALPPLNGFVSELLIYIGLFKTLGQRGVPQWSAAAAAVPAIALAGALAVAAFAKVLGTVFLGEPRTHSARHAHESAATMLIPMAVLALLCLLLGAFPAMTAPVIDRAVAFWWAGAGAAPPPLLSISPLGLLPLISLSILILGGLAFAAIRRAMVSTSRPGTWDCGYAAPSSRMQYTGSSFAQFLVDLFAWALRPRVKRPELRGPFPASRTFESEVPDTVLDRGVAPFVRITSDFLRWARLLQQGQIQVYVLYILLTVLALFMAVYAA